MTEPGAFCNSVLLCLWRYVELSIDFMHFEFRFLYESAPYIIVVVGCVIFCVRFRVFI